MPRRKQRDLSGSVIGRWSVLSRVTTSGRTMWLCRCACGVERVLQHGNLTRGTTTQCATCSKAAKACTTLAGTRIGQWTVLRTAEKHGRHAAWVCQCSCGAVKEVLCYNLRSGASRSCRACAMSRVNTRHGQSHSAVYVAWQSAVQRCHNPLAQSYRFYGGRGIFVCDRWRYSFDLFLSDMGPRPSGKHSLDRINNNLGYEPSNCRWALPMVQFSNKRNATLLTALGVTRSINWWAKHLMIYPSGVYIRRRRGDDIYSAIASASAASHARSESLGAERALA